MNDEELRDLDPYADISQLYDLEHDDFTHDVDLLVNFVEIVGDPILEMGCGSGRIARAIAAQGFRVTGIDTSQPMLDRARQASKTAGLQDLITLQHLDMIHADQAIGGPFGLALFTLNSLMHLPTSSAQRAALSATRSVMDPRGQIIIDVLNPHPAHMQELTSGPLHEGTWMLDDATIVDKWSLRKPGVEPQILDTILWYDHTHPDGRLTRTRTSFELRYVYPSELVLMLELAGYVEPMLYGSYELDPFEPESDRLIVTAEITESSRR